MTHVSSRAQRTTNLMLPRWPNASSLYGRIGLSGSLSEPTPSTSFCLRHETEHAWMYMGLRFQVFESGEWLIEAQASNIYGLHLREAQALTKRLGWLDGRVRKVVGQGFQTVPDAEFDATVSAVLASCRVTQVVEYPGYPRPDNIRPLVPADVSELVRALRMRCSARSLYAA